MKLVWDESAWEEYLFWQTQDKKTLRRINELLKSVQRGPFHGIGKPEPLRHGGPNRWSRRIDEENRLVYRITETAIEIASCKTHYE